MKPWAKDLYERDYQAWTVARRLPSWHRLTERRVNRALDLERLAEDVGDLGRRERDAVRSQMRRMIEHVLQLEYSPATDPRDGWKDTITTRAAS